MLALRPTFSESWYRVASLKIRLRPGAQITRQYHRGERWYVVRDPAATQFMRLSDGAYHFIGLLDGKRTVSEAWELAGGQMDDAAPTQPEVIQILSQLHGANLVEADISPDAQVLLRRHKSMQRQQWKQRAMNILFPRLPLPFDLNGLVTRWMPVMKVLFSTGGMIAWLVVVIAAIATIAPDWQELGKQTSAALEVSNWGWLWLVFVFTKVIHEFGHAFACRRFGGEVHEMGIMLLVFIPTPYVDASSAWAFPSRWQRMFVGAAGMYTELFFAAIMAFVWKATGDPFWQQVAMNAMLVASVSTVLFNANPLLRYDGYYMLSDFLEIPNLQQKSREYGWGLVKRHVFRIKQQQPLPSLLQRFWLFNYWWASSFYRLFVGVMIILMVSARVPVLGDLMALGGIVTWCVVPVVTLFRYLTIEPELHRKRGRAWAFTLAVATLIIVVVGLIRIPVRVSSQAIIGAEHRDVLKAGYDGIVKALGTVDGHPLQDEQLVKQGDVLLVMENETLSSKIKQTQAKLQMAELRRQQAITTDQVQRLIEEEQIKALREQLDALREHEASLVIKAPFAGRLIAPNLHTLPGQFLERGKEFAILVTMDKLEARAIIDQNDAHYLDVFETRAKQMPADEPDMQTQIRLSGAVQEVIHPIGPPIVVKAAQPQIPHPSLNAAAGGTASVDPRDQQGVRAQIEPFEVVLKLDNTGVTYMPGQRAYIRFTVDRQPIIAQIWRKFEQLLMTRNLTNPWS